MEHYKFNQHKKCEFFPCHHCHDTSKFNCLFCFCPLYMLGPDCGGNYKYLENGTKDCSACMLVHSPKGYEHVMSKFEMIMKRAEKNEIKG